jgi:hypothetical protein
MSIVSSRSLSVLKVGILLGALHCSSAAEDEGGGDIPEYGSPPAAPGAMPAAPAAPNAQGNSNDPSTTSPTPDGTSEAPPDPSFMGGTDGMNGSTPAASNGTPPTTPSDPNTPPATPADPNTPPAPPSDPNTPPTPPSDPGTPAEPAPPPNTFVERGGFRGFATPAKVVAATTLSPTTFDARQPGQPFCIAGNVAPDPAFQGEAAIKFTINQAASSDVAGQAAPVLTTVPTGTGLALSFSKSVAHTLRIQLEPPDGGDPWCYEVPEVTGTAFAPYAQFNTACWDGSGQAYAGQPIQAVNFQVPGDDTLTIPYGFCINGFADGRSVNDAPTDITSGGELLSGSISGALDRVKVLGTNGESYVVQNNAWGSNSSDGSQVIQYTGNSFQIMRQAAPPNGDQVTSFPSVFIGSNGFRGSNGSLTTALDDGLPIRVSDIQSVQTRLRHNGGNGDYNVTYDVWFAANPPQGEYDTAQSAFLMVWLYKPGNRTAIGCNGNSPNVTVDGRTWRLCVGNRSEGSDGNGGNAPVISYLHEGAAIPDYAFDLNVFIRDAITRSQAGQLNGANFNANLFLTDVFGGFEIWSGGQGLRVDEFTAVVR